MSKCSEPLSGSGHFNPTNTFVPFPKTDLEHSISDRFEQQVNLYPERTAVRHKGKAISYRVLNGMANRVARALVRAWGEEQKPVALLLENSEAAIAAILGVLKSGKIYVPLDPSVPRARTEFILQDSQAEVILTNNKNVSLAQELGFRRSKLVNLDELDNGFSTANVGSTISPDVLAYIIYTSGSTGQPKGVIETHRNLMHNAMRNTNVLHICAEDRVSLLRSIGAGGAARDALTALLNGATLCLFSIKEDGLGSLSKWLIDERITVFSSVITVFRHLVATLTGEEKFDNLRLIYAGGEQATKNDVDLYRKYFSQECLFVNRLGITETGTVAYYFIDKGTSLIEDTVPVGYAAEDMEILLLDADGKEVGPDCTGEIAVRGRYLSPGYWRCPELTRSVFLPDPEGGDKRIYRTGDLGRKLPDGCLVHLGWKDFQVNIRGHRIDVAEVETALLNHPGLKEVAVVGREHWSGEIRLAAAFVPVGNAVLSAVDLRKFLKNRLPDYMIPSAFMQLDALPLGPNWKVDRRALPSPDWLPLQQSSKYVAARTELEEFIVEIWEETLGLDVVGVHDNFFDLGGHSLLLGEIVSKLQSAFNVDVPLGDFVEQPTVATLAKIIRTALQLNQGSSASITSVSRPNKLPLSFAQERLWFLDQLEPDTAAYNIPTATLIEGQLNVEAMEKALNEVGKRHEALRTTFTVTNGEPTQVILPELSLTLPVVDLSDLSEAESEAEARRLITEHAQRSFDLSEAPLLRALLLKLSHNKHVFVTIHHLIADAWSIGILFDELSIFYDMYSSGKSSAVPELPVQYADFAVWQRQLLQGEALEFHVSYWKQQLGNNLSVVELPIDRPRPVRESFRGARQYFALAESLTDAIKDLSRRESVTLFMTLLGAFKTLLYRYSNREEVIVGSPIAGRNRTEVENLIGLFANTLVLRTDLSGNPTFRGLLRRVRDVCLEAYIHQDLPFEKLVEELQPVRDLSRNPLFQVMFILQNTPVSVINFTKLMARRLEVDSGTAKFDLTLSLAEHDKKLIGSFEYSTDLFDGSTIERMFGHFRTLLEGIVADPDRTISSFPLLTEKEKHQLLLEWNDTAADYPKDSCIHELFEAQVKKTPEAVAVQFEGRQLTYRELNSRANQLARYLLGLGLGPEKLVGICVERSLDMLIGLLGILKAGGAYVPLDPTYPKERLELMLKDSRCSFLLTEQRFIEDGRCRPVLSEAEGIEDGDRRSSILDPRLRVIFLDRDWPLIAQKSDNNPKSRINSHNLAYVIYTSGSTGQPKGVQIEHRSVINCLLSIREQIGLTEKDILLAVTNISFDIAALETYLPLTTGAKLVWASQDEVLDAKLLLDRLTECGATVMQATPSAWRLLLDAGWQSGRNFKILCGGEVLSRPLADQLLRGGASLWNLYGPTETTIWSTIAKVEPGESPVPIGRPIANTQTYILDSHLQPVPVGVHGELYIGGDGLARGYLNRSELTAERFVPNPFGDRPDLLLYWTGDLARYRPGGNIEFLGRIDSQVKIRGHRIELGEIESVLNQHPAMKETVIVFRECDSSGDKDLVAYFVPRQDSSPSVMDLREFLRRKVPEYMVPVIFISIDALPLSPNGKVDRSKLPLPDDSRPSLEETFVEPRTEIEELVAQVWLEVLKLEKIGIYDNFFDVGGHSLLATRVVARLRNNFSIDMPLRTLFELPTVAGLAGAVETALRVGQKINRPPILRVPRGAKILPSIAQELLLLLDELVPSNHLFNIPRAYRLTGPLDLLALGRSLNAVVARHEAFRTSFPTVDGEWIQFIAPSITLNLNVTDLQRFPQSQREPEMRALAREEKTQSFDLVNGPLLRVKLFQTGPEQHVLLTTFHHIITDGWSINVFFQDLAAFYEAFSRDRQPLLAELPIQFADFSSWQRQALADDWMLNQLAYWEEQLKSPLTVLELVTNRRRSSELSFLTARTPVSVTGDVFDSLKKLSREEMSTLFMTVLSALKILLYAHSGQEDIRVGTLVANRDWGETDKLIGHFVNTLIIRTRINAGSSFRQLQRDVRHTTLEAQARQSLPFETLLRSLERATNLNRSALAQVMFVYQMTTSNSFELPGLTVEPLEDIHDTAAPEITITTFDLILLMKETQTGLLGSLIYKTEIFDETIIGQFLGHFHEILERIGSDPAQLVSELCIQKHKTN